MFPNPKFWQIPLMSDDDLNRQVGFNHSSHDSKDPVILVEQANLSVRLPQNLDLTQKP